MDSIVSVIIPVFNTAPYLEECIESVINQTYQRIEIILVDDGSTDGSEIICDQYASSDNRIKVIHQENKGVSSARNAGIRLATAKWIMFVDADDWIEKESVSRALQQIDEKIDMVVLPFINSQVNREIGILTYDVEAYRTDFLGACRINNMEYFPEIMRVGLRLTSQCAKLYKASIIKDNKIYFPEDIKDNEDSIFNFQYIMKADIIQFVNFQMYHVRERENSASRTFEGRGKRVIQSLEAFEALLIQYDVQEKMSKYQSIDGFLKIFQIIISCCKMHSAQKLQFVKCYIEYKKYICAPISTKLIKKARIKDVYSIVNKLVVICLKAHLYLIVFVLFDFYYRVIK